MAKKKRIPVPLMVAFLLLPVAGLAAWLMYDSGLAKSGEHPKRSANQNQDGSKVTVVVTAGGEPAEGAAVVVLSLGERRQVQARRTGPKGRAEVTGLPQGKTRVAVRMAGYERAKREITLKAKSQQTVAIDLQSKEAGGSPEPSASADDPEDDQRVVARRVENTRGEAVHGAAVGRTDAELPGYVKFDPEGRLGAERGAKVQPQIL